MIRFSNVSKAYHGATQPALQGLNFHLPVGSMTYLVGHSGAGKSTLLKLIMGMERRMPVIFGLMVMILRVCLNMKSHFYAAKSVWFTKITVY